MKLEGNGAVFRSDIAVTNARFPANNFALLSMPNHRNVKPFLKWAGGKGQLLPQLQMYFPTELEKGSIAKYVEPFVGSGAVFFYIAQYYGYLVREFWISDVNFDLMVTYKTIQQDVEALVERLSEIQTEYLQKDEAARKAYFYQMRSRFNQQRSQPNFREKLQANVERTAQIIFLNRTCFNGLFRVNSKGEFNVPYGRYKNPKICYADNLYNIAKVLQKTHIRCGHYTISESFIDGNSFVYLDPPYRPINKTSRFTSYSQFVFGDAEQLALRDFCLRLHAKGAKLMLSNSDPKNENPEDNFFENAYQGFSLYRLQASRHINSNKDKRGKINELLIANYPVSQNL